MRCVDIEDATKVKVDEFFLGFVKVDDKLGLGFSSNLKMLWLISNSTLMI